MRQSLRPEELEQFLPYASEGEAEKILAIIQTGGYTKAAARLGVNQSAVSRAVSGVVAKAAMRGFSPGQGVNYPTPAGYSVSGVSTLLDEDGNPRLQWVKTKIDQNAFEALLAESLEAFKESLPAAKVTKPAALKRHPDLLNVHVLTDYHLGMKSWHEETGADWDIKIAEDLLAAWFDLAIAQAPAARTGVLAQLGDFLHWDGMDAVTPASKHLLDADTRFQKVVRVAIRSLRRIIGAMLKKYEHVHLIMADANHDPASSIWLREVFSEFYRDEPRITVDDSADTFYCLEHGEVSLFFHHGHKIKPGLIDDVMVAKFRDVFGRTKHSFCHMGHLHHSHLIETRLMIVEQHRTMAAPDSYASRHGWMSGRGASVITYDKTHGEVSRFAIAPEMVQ